MSGSRQRGEARTGWALLTPTLLIVLVVVVAPILWTILLAFQRVRVIDLRRRGLIGEFTFQNIERVFGSPGFWDTLWTTVAYTVFGVAISVGLGLAAALAVRRPFRGRTFVRASFLLPYIAPVVGATFVWQTMLNPEYGVLNAWGTRFLGWDRPVDFLNEVSGSLFGIPVPTALVTVILFEGWRYFPFAFLFLLARMQALPSDLEEAALVDGATPTQRFRHVVLPQLLPVIAVLTVLRFVLTFTKFDDVYLLTGGGSGTEVVSVRVYDFLTSRGDIGAASAEALVLAIALAVFVGIYLRLVRRS
ncbi:permease component of ABC-type sugar transporter [Cryptosporangium arvum DSM 44712]|uniref:Permease component of ABC-type sugar transporter n=1 Tax=Cryptosporangium arvum DSM 44712 TaxID=927661 RepID=A0A010YJ25_9ACTN|nr:sugar ABC transporter permease [Cryptosporangium arvum]EXG80225.1 permease component of ABC-type sugar transporter [Cryptosporangium arvum DSM 44712]